MNDLDTRIVRWNACSREWRDPFGELNRCGKRAGHKGDCLAHWAVLKREEAIYLLSRAYPAGTLQDDPEWVDEMVGYMQDDPAYADEIRALGAATSDTPGETG